MNIFVVFKQFLDKNYESDPKKTGYLEQSDKNVLLEALDIREKTSGRVTCIMLGSQKSKIVLQEALALDIDRAVLIEDDNLTSWDGRKAARKLAKGIKLLGDFDLILCGRQSIDGDSARMSSFIAKEISIPKVMYSKEIQLQESIARIVRFTEYGNQVVEIPLPALIMSMREQNTIRYPKVTDILKAYSGEYKIEEIKLTDIEVDKAEEEYIKAIGSYPLHSKGEKEIVWIEGKSEKEKAEKLLQKIRNLSFIV